MSGKSRTGQRQGKPAGQGQPAAQRPGQSAARRKNDAAAHQRKAKLTAARQAQRRRKITVRAGIAAGVAAIVAVLFVIFQNSPSSSTSSVAGAYPYQAGTPGLGQAAPGFTLAASSGGQVSLSQYRGKSVLLFFQEGLTCQPCWDQIADLQRHAPQLRAEGIGQVLSVTTDPVGAITRKTRDMGLTIPV